MVARATSSDADDAVAVLRAAHPRKVFTRAGIRHRIDHAEPSEQLAAWKAEDDGRIVGWATASLDAFAPGSGRAFASIAVHPGARRRGHGSALWEAVAAHLDEIGAHTTNIHSDADDAARRFAELRGFVHATTDTLLGLDPRRITPGDPPAGVEIVSMSQFAADLRPVYECDAEAAIDEPGPFDVSGLTFETWLRLVERPETDLELSVAAVANALVVGTSLLNADRESGVAEAGGTGVRRAFRGRGIALAMKRVSLAWAAEAGIASAVTHNDVTNAPMLAVNSRLGYVPIATGLWWRLET